MGGVSIGLETADDSKRGTTHNFSLSKGNFTLNFCERKIQSMVIFNSDKPYSVGLKMIICNEYFSNFQLSKLKQ